MPSDKPDTGEQGMAEGMQLVAFQGSPRSVAFGHQVSELSLMQRHVTLRLHTVESGATASWTNTTPAPVLVVLEGIGKFTVEGASQRFSGPCLLAVPPHAGVAVKNQGSTAMRILELAGT